MSYSNSCANKIQKREEQGLTAQKLSNPLSVLNFFFKGKSAKAANPLDLNPRRSI